MRFADPFARKTQHAILSIAAAIVAAVTMGADAPGAEEGSTTLSPQALQEIAQLEAEIDRIEARTIERLAAPPDNQIQQIELLVSKPQRGLCVLSHAGDGLYRSRVGAKPDHRLLSRVSTHAIQRSQAAIARLRTALARAALQPGAG